MFFGLIVEKTEKSHRRSFKQRQPCPDSRVDEMSISHRVQIKNRQNGCGQLNKWCTQRSTYSISPTTTTMYPAENTLRKKEPSLIIS